MKPPMMTSFGVFANRLAPVSNDNICTFEISAYHNNTGFQAILLYESLVSLAQCFTLIF